MRNSMTNGTVLFRHFIALFWLLSTLYITLSMGRAPCCEKVGLKKGPWTSEEDHRLREYITRYGNGCWRTLPKKAGLFRCGKSCRLRWINYLQPNLKRGNITEEEDRIIIESHAAMGNRWSVIASQLPGRTDNEIKNYWNTHLKKKLRNMGLDPQTHQPRHDTSTSSTSIPKFTIQTASTNSNYIPEMIKREAGSVKGEHSNSKENLCCREQLLSSSYHFNEAYKFPPSSIRSNISETTNSWSISDIRDRSINMSRVQPSPYGYFNETCKFTTNNSISNNCVISNYSSASDIRDNGKNIAPMKPELAPESQGNSITDPDCHEFLMYSNLFKSSVIAHCSSTSDTRGINIANMKVEPDPEPPANSITNLVPGWSGLNSLDTVNHCPAAVSSTKDQEVLCNTIATNTAAVSSTKDQEVLCNTIATNTANSMSADNDPSTVNVPAFSNVSSPNHQLNLVDCGLFLSSPVINMDRQPSNVEEYLQVEKDLEAAVQWAFNDPISLDLLK